MDDDIALRWETDGWSQTRLSLTGLQLHTWQRLNRKWALTELNSRSHGT